MVTGRQRRATIASGSRESTTRASSRSGLNPGDFDLPSFGYHAELYVDRSPQSETQCMPTFDDFRREFEGRDPELRYVLANRGTEITSAADWSTNGRQAVGMDDPQYQQAVRLARAVYARVGGRITFTGHSLGGGLASAQALATGAPAVTFNAAGLDDATVGRGSSRRVTPPDIAAYSVGGEALTLLQEHAPRLFGLLGHVADRAVGTPAVLSPVANDVLDPLSLHSIDSVITSLEAALAESESRGLSRMLARTETSVARSLDPDRVAAEQERDLRGVLPAYTNQQLVERARSDSTLWCSRGERDPLGPLTRAAYAQTLMEHPRDPRRALRRGGLTGEALPDLPARAVPTSCGLAGRGIVALWPEPSRTSRRSATSTLWAGLAGDVPRPPPPTSADHRRHSRSRPSIFR